MCFTVMNVLAPTSLAVLEQTPSGERSRFNLTNVMVEDLASTREQAINQVSGTRRMEWRWTRAIAGRVKDRGW
jgi:hypothetical protein